MTVCIAALFTWSYPPTMGGSVPTFGRAAAVLSDRMITAGDIQYEPQQLKIATISPRILLLIAGDYSIHSQAIKDTQKQTRNILDATPHNVALIYGHKIQAIKQRQAEDLYLAPLGLNMDTFLAQQRDLSEGFVQSITSQIQNFKGEDCAALVVGSDGENAQIYEIDHNGTVHCRDDVGFAAIGIGAGHALSRFMQAGYVNSVDISRALAASYSAKKNAEVAPGVGKATDIHLVFKDNIEPLWSEIAEKLDELYAAYEKRRSELADQVVAELIAFLPTVPELRRRKAVSYDNETRPSGGGAELDEPSSGLHAEHPES